MFGSEQLWPLPRRARCLVHSTATSHTIWSFKSICHSLHPHIHLSSCVKRVQPCHALLPSTMSTCSHSKWTSTDHGCLLTGRHLLGLGTAPHNGILGSTSLLWTTMSGLMSAAAISGRGEHAAGERQREWMKPLSLSILYDTLCLGVWKHLPRGETQGAWPERVPAMRYMDGTFEILSSSMGKGCSLPIGLSIDLLGDLTTGKLARSRPPLLSCPVGLVLASEVTDIMSSES